VHIGHLTEEELGNPCARPVGSGGAAELGPHFIGVTRARLEAVVPVAIENRLLESAARSALGSTRNRQRQQGDKPEKNGDSPS